MVDPKKLEYCARALSPFIWDDTSVQVRDALPGTVEIQRKRTLSRARRVLQAADEYDRLCAAGTESRAA